MRLRQLGLVSLACTLLACDKGASIPDAQSPGAAAIDRVGRGDPTDWQLLVVYIGSTGCGFSRDPELRSAVTGMHAQMRAQAETGAWRLSIAAVALDPSPDSGYAYLKGLGPWNEMVVGGNWGNLGAETHVWRPEDGVSSVPQIIVLERRAFQDTTRIRFGTNHVLKRYIGTAEIIDWLKAGGTLPAPGKSRAT